MNNKYMMLIAGGVVAILAASGLGYFFGKHNADAAYGDGASPQIAAASTGAPSVPGLCVLSQNGVYANAKIGQAATARYRQLDAGLRGQLSPEQQTIQDAAKKLEAARASMPAAQFQQQEQVLAERIRALQAANALGTRELEATRVKALKQIAALANPFITEAYKTHHCGVLFSRDMMLAGNPGMDLTPAVVRGLDSKVTTIAFDLEHLPATPSAP